MGAEETEVVEGKATADEDDFEAKLAALKGSRRAGAGARRSALPSDWEGCGSRGGLCPRDEHGLLEGGGHLRRQAGSWGPDYQHCPWCHSPVAAAHLRGCRPFPVAYLQVHGHAHRHGVVRPLRERYHTGYVRPNKEGGHYWARCWVVG